jgi:hypothetical protein
MDSISTSTTYVSCTLGGSLFHILSGKHPNIQLLIGPNGSFRHDLPMLKQGNLNNLERCKVYHSIPNTYIKRIYVTYMEIGGISLSYQVKQMKVRHLMHWKIHKNVPTEHMKDYYG